MEYVSTACQFCGGTLINKNNGEYVCAYCLQPLDRSNGKLSDGYNKLASYNFVGAASFFRGMIGVGGAEAYYGLFLAENRIEENKQKNARPLQNQVLKNTYQLMGLKFLSEKTIFKMIILLINLHVVMNGGSTQRICLDRTSLFVATQMS